jgi:glycosyltransferase involved in cell wall biosynthesis
MHLIAREISREFSLPWIADFRDPWTNIDYYADLMLTSLADRKHHRLEKSVVTGATRVVVVGKTMKEEFEREYARKVDVITNGFDEDDVRQVPAENAGQDKFIIAHVGTLVRSRNPVVFWNAVSRKVKADAGFSEHLEIRLTGKVDIAVRNSIKDAGLDPCVKYIEYLPHDKVVAEQQRASLLLLVLNNTKNAKGILTGKMFEYLAAGRPVLGIGPPDGDAAEIIHETKSGVVIDFDNQQGMQKELDEFYGRFQRNELWSSASGVEKYSRKSLTGNLVKILNEITQ